MAKADKASKLMERKTALLAKLKELEKEESAALSAAKEAHRKEDTRAKTLIGIALVAEVAKNPVARSVIKLAADNLTVRDAAWLRASSLWKQLFPDAIAAAPSDAPAPPAPAQPQTPTQPEKTSPAASQRIAHVATALPKADYYAKDKVKALGATFVVESKTWFVPAGADLTPFANWL